MAIINIDNNNKAGINFFLITVSGMATWLWSETMILEHPYLTPFVPEGWTLGSYINFMKGTSTGCLLFLPFILKAGLVKATLIMYWVGFIFSISLNFLWDVQLEPSKLFPNGISLGLLANTFVLFGLDSIKMTLIFTLIDKMFTPTYLTSTMLGDSLAKLAVTILTFTQGFNVNFINNRERNWSVERNEQFYLENDFLFDPDVVIAICTVLYGVCCLTLSMVIHINPEKVENVSKMENEDMQRELAEKIDYGELETFIEKTEQPQKPDISWWWNILKRDFWLDDIQSTFQHCFFIIFFWFVVAGTLFTFMPSFFSFSTIPYSQQCFNLSVVFTSVTRVITTLSAHFSRPFNKLIYFAVLLLAHLAVCLWLIIIASMSPEPPLNNSLAGEVIVIVLWSLEGATGFFLSCKCCTGLGRIKLDYAVKWGTIIAQIGDVCGSVFGFILINYTDWFQEY